MGFLPRGTRVMLHVPSAASDLRPQCVRSTGSVHRTFAQAWWHWFFFAQPEKPEGAILADRDAYLPSTAPLFAIRRPSTA
jgi:hypothetical protein